MSMVEYYVLFIAAITYSAIGRAMIKNTKLKAADKVAVFILWPFITIYWAFRVKLKGK